MDYIYFVNGRVTKGVLRVDIGVPMVVQYSR